MRKNLAAACFALLAFLFSAPLYAQSTAPVVLPGGCGTGNATNSLSYLTVDPTLRLCIAGSGSGGSTPVTPGALTPLSPMQTALAITASTGLTVPTGSTYSVVCAEGANVRYSTDGTTTPTASVGMQLLQNQCLPLQGATTIANFKAIQQSATATLDASYFK